MHDAATVSGLVTAPEPAGIVPSLAAKPWMRLKPSQAKGVDRHYRI